MENTCNAIRYSYLFIFNFVNSGYTALGLTVRFNLVAYPQGLSFTSEFIFLLHPAVAGALS